MIRFGQFPRILCFGGNPTNTYCGFWHHKDDSLLLFAIVSHHYRWRMTLIICLIIIIFRTTGKVDVLSACCNQYSTGRRKGFTFADNARWNNGRRKTVEDGWTIDLDSKWLNTEVEDECTDVDITIETIEMGHEQLLTWNRTYNTCRQYLSS